MDTSGTKLPNINIPICSKTEIEGLTSKIDTSPTFHKITQM